MRRIDLTDCPEPLKSLLGKYDNNFEETAVALGYKPSSKAWLRRVAKRDDMLGDDLSARIESVLINGTAPPRKVAGAVLKKQHKMRKMTVTKLTDYPPLLQELIQRYGATITAAKALGFKSQYWITKFNGPDAVPFDKKSEALVRAVLKGKAPVVADKLTKKKAKKAKKKIAADNGLDDDIDAGSLGLAIVLSTPNVLEALFDAGEAMGGEWVYKKRIGKQWLSVCRLDHQELHAFRAIARVIAIEVATP